MQITLRHNVYRIFLFCLILLISEAFTCSGDTLDRALPKKETVVQAAPDVTSSKKRPALTPQASPKSPRSAVRSDRTDQNVSEILYYFPDNCFDAKDKDPDKALERCRHLRKHGEHYQRGRCRCRKTDMITVRTDDPVAYYLETCGYGTAATESEAKKKCLAHQAKHGNDKQEPHCDCKNRIVTIKGPYLRHWAAPNTYDDIETFRYLNPINGRWYAADGEPPCFTAGTPILTPDGPVAIETLAPGDRVIAWDETKNRETIALITHTKKKPHQEVGELILVDGRRLSVTRNHPFYVADTRSWELAQHLRPAMPLLVFENGTTRRVDVASIRFGRYVDFVYNLSVNGPNTYLANGVLVHNY